MAFDWYFRGQAEQFFARFVRDFQPKQLEMNLGLLGSKIMLTNADINMDEINATRPPVQASEVFIERVRITIPPAVQLTTQPISIAVSNVYVLLAVPDDSDLLARDAQRAREALQTFVHLMLEHVYKLPEQASGGADPDGDGDAGGSLPAWYAPVLENLQVRDTRGGGRGGGASQDDESEVAAAERKGRQRRVVVCVRVTTTTT